MTNVERIGAESKLRGYFQLFRKAGTKILNRVFHDRVIVFRHSGEVVQSDRERLEILSFRRLSDLPSDVLQYLGVDTQKDCVAALEKRFNSGGILYIVRLEDCVVSRLWMRHGKDIPKWYVPLNDEDFALSSMHTSPEYRGQGIIRVLAARAILDGLKRQGNGYVDCYVWNKPSLKALHSMGFRPIATLPPLASLRFRAQNYFRKVAR